MSAAAIRIVWVGGKKASVVGLSAPETRNKVPVSAAPASARERLA